MAVNAVERGAFEAWLTQVLPNAPPESVPHPVAPGSTSTVSDLLPSGLWYISLDEGQQRGLWDWFKMGVEPVGLRAVLERGGLIPWHLSSVTGSEDDFDTIADRIREETQSRAESRGKQAASGAAPAPTKAALDGAENLSLDDINLYDDYIPDIFTPLPERQVEEILHQVGRELVGRRLNKQELDRLKPAYRRSERNIYGSDQELKRRSEISSTLKSLDRYADTLIGSTVDGKMIEDRTQALEVVRRSPEYAEALKLSQESFTPFTEELGQIEVLEGATGVVDPREQAGVELRKAAEGFASALARGVRG